jgi:putative transposase
MSRAMRLEFPNALYHVTSRGNAQQNIYLTDADRHQFLRYLTTYVSVITGWYTLIV